MVTNAIYKWGNQQQVNLAQASQKVNAEHRERLLSLPLLARQMTQSSSLESVILFSRTCLSVLRLCLLECRDPLIASRNGDLHFPSHNCFTTSR